MKTSQNGDRTSFGPKLGLNVTISLNNDQDEFPNTQKIDSQE